MNKKLSTNQILDILVDSAAKKILCGMPEEEIIQDMISRGVQVNVARNVINTSKNNAVLIGKKFNICQSTKKFNKVFGIGASKTGTTSLEGIFKAIGLRSAPQQEGELCGLEAYRGNLKPLVDYINKYDAFQDAPFSIKNIYAQVDALFPGSKFIFTYRDPEEWFSSLCRFHMKLLGVIDINKINKDKIDTWDYLYRGYVSSMFQLGFLLVVNDDYSTRVDWSLLYNKEQFIAKYISRNKGILEHFSERPDDLLVIDITKEDNTSKVVDFLGLPHSFTTKTPHMNKT